MVYGSCWKATFGQCTAGTFIDGSTVVTTGEIFFHLQPAAIPFVWDNGLGFHVQESDGQLELFAS